jgi:hypothetical protein
MMDTRRPLLLVLAAAAGCGAAGTADDAAAVMAPGTAAVAPGTQAAASQPAAAGAAAPGAQVAPALTPQATATAPVGAANPAVAPAGGAVPATPTTEIEPMSAVPGDPISKECEGFSFEGLIYSPGGTVLPNKCAPFHATNNNPYAVRCVDAWPWFKTQFMGDNFCVLPPTPGKGTQLGHHPQGEEDAWFKAVSTGDMSGYEMSAITAAGEGWVLDPADEEERNINIRQNNEGGNYWRTYNRMRGGSHHMIAGTTTSTDTFKWGPGGIEIGGGGGRVPGSQRPDDNRPGSPEIPAEDEGLYSPISANVTVVYNMHHFNPTDKPILKEAWQNLWFTENATQQLGGISGLALDQVAGVFAQPGQVADIHYSTTAPGDVRIVSLFGHRHAWTTNFSVWVQRGGMLAAESPEIIYQSFDWFDEPTYQYNSEVKNPPIGWQTRTDGAHSGILNLKAGDELHFNCHIEYTDERAKEENSPVTPSENGPLRFANQAFEAEMCILFGSAVGSNGSPARQGAVPDFAKAR